MRKRLMASFGMLLLSGFCISAIAQNATLRSAAGDKYLISAKAGGVSYVEGDVRTLREVGKSGMLLKGDTVEVGDKVITGTDGRAEILLNPGSYARLGENSEFEFITTDLEDLKLKVNRGSAILEVYAANDFRVSISSPQDTFALIDTGVYRLDVDASGRGRLEVWKGKAEAGDAVLKGGRAVAGDETNAIVEKFDRDDKDAFETWSKARSKELAKTTGQLKDRALRTTLIRSYLGGGWNMYNSFGLWIFDASMGRYCFLPFGYGWSSPYGYGFGNDIWWYQLPRAVYYPPRNPPAGSPVPPGGSRGGEFPGDRRPRIPADKTPPYVGMQGGTSTGPKFSKGIEKGGGFGDTGGMRGPIFNPSPTPVFGTPSKSEPVSAPPTMAPSPISRGKGQD